MSVESPVSELKNISNTMKWNTVGLFATPLVKIELEDTEKAKQYFFSNIHKVSNREANVEGAPESNGLFHFHHHTSVFEVYPDLKWLQIKIEEAGNFAYRELLNYKKSGPLKITNAWFNLCDVGASQSMHSHANSLLSGTLYLKTDSNSRIKFYHPLTSISQHPEIFDKPAESKNKYGLRYHHREIIVDVSAGECLFWPSQLQHGYVNNLTPQRLSLSFNLMPEYLNNIYQVSSNPGF